MFKIKYYRHTRNFYENLTVKDDELHITQSASLADLLRENARHVFGYKAFIKNLFPSWNHPHTDVFIQSIVRQYLLDHVDRRDASYFEKLVQDYSLSFRFLIDFGGLPLHEFPDITEEQKLLAAMYKELSKDPFVVDHFTDRASLTKQIVRERLGIHHDINTIYFHHFDYIDSLRVMLFQLLKKIGFEVVFYIPFQPESKDLYKSWFKIYEQLSETSHEEWECVEYSSESKGSRFAHYLDDHVEINEQEREDIAFLAFDHPTKFKDYLQSHPILKNKHEVITTFEENLNIYTDHTVKKHFYATTYGKFFLSLQNCKKTEDGIILSYDDYVNMLVSGWVQAGNTNGTQALTLLIDLRDYMEGVSTFPEIMERLQSLLQLQEFGQVFDELGKEQSERNRLKRYLSNPFRAFPYLHSTRYSITVRQLIDCTKDLARKVNRLLPDNREKRNVQEYIGDIQRIYESVRENWEPEIAEKFEAIFRTEIPAEWEFGKEELFQLLSYYFASEKKENDEKIQNFDQLVGKVLSSDHVHVTGLSLKTFPWKSPSLPALLNHTWLKNCIYQSFISNNRKLRLNALLVDYYSREVTRNTALYALYHLLSYSKGNITLSYIEELQENDGPSIYFTVLKELYEKDSGIPSESITQKYEWDESPLSLNTEIPEEAFSKVPDLLWLDSDFCHKKFFLNTFVEHHPVYEKDFHQQIAFSAIGKLLTEQGDGEEEVRELVFPLFPQWTNAHKQNLLDTAFSKGLRSYKSFENIYYPKAMKRLQVLYSRYEVTKNWKAKYRYDHDTFKLDEQVKDFKAHVSGNEIHANAGNHCRMCPFLHVCKEGEYVIDANDY